MNQLNKRALKIVSLALLGLSFASCLRKTETVAPISKGPEIEVGRVEDSLGFRVDGCLLTEGTPLTAGNIADIESAPPAKCAPGNFFTHKTSSHQAEYSTEACALTDKSKLRTSDALLNCFIEADEMELRYHGVSMAFNMPSDYCEYFTLLPYYFWNLPPGDEANTNGANEVRMVLNLEDKVMQFPSSTDPELLDGFKATTTGASGGSEYNDALLNSSGNGARCAYDYSSARGPNCCEGSYKVFTCKATDTNNDSLPDAPNGSFHTGDFAFCPQNYITNETTEEWGGDPRNCLTGPGVITGENFRPTLFVAPVGGKGINSVFRSYGENDNLWKLGLNYYSANHYAYYSGLPASAVDSLDPDDASETNHPATLRTLASWRPSPVYEFSCYDRGYEILARIRVFVREWNTVADLNGFKAGTAGFLTPDIPDAAGNESGTGVPTKNDFPDLRDLGLPIFSTFPSRRSLVNGFTSEDTFSLAAKLSDEHPQCDIGSDDLDEGWSTP